MLFFSRLVDTFAKSATLQKVVSYPGPSGIAAVARQHIKRAKIHHVYYMLAAFDLCAVGGGIYLVHSLTQLYVESVSVNETWAGHMKSLSKLGELAQVTNAPGNDIFDSRDVDTERARQEAALKEFTAQLTNIKLSLAGTKNEDLIQSISKIGTAMDEMVVEAGLIFQFFASGESSRAGERMATMDRKYGKLSRAINDSVEIMQYAQAKQLDVQLGEADAMRRYEYLGGALMLLIVCVVVGFGHQISATIKTAQDEKDVASEQLKVVNESITNLNVELANNILKLKEAQEENIKKGKMAQLGQLTATVAHEIRNPLGAIKTSTQLVERKVKDKDLGLEKLLERINNGVSRCDHIISELLDFARAKALQLRTANVDAWVKEIVDAEAKSLPAGVAVTFDAGLGDTNAAFDAERMGRVLINLLSNAAEAMVGKGNVKVAVVTENPAIHVSTKAVNGNIEITVKDNGPGISGENIKEILEPLFTTKSFGVGLGLPAVEKILEHHGGGLKIASKAGEGASFTAWFPIGQAQVRAA